MKKIIYEPTGKAAEFSLLAANLYEGCEHQCDYCFVPTLPQWHDKDFRTFKPIVRPKVIENLLAQASQYAGTDLRVLLCFTCDPYQPLELETQTTRKAIEIFRRFDIPFQVLTKAGTMASRDFRLYSEYDAFATTLTFIDEADSRKHEPNAAIPRSRILALEMAKACGIHTWVSLEPVIDENQTLEIIRATHKYVDLYKIGKLNYSPSEINWSKFAKKAIMLCRDLHKNYYIKKDLANQLYGFSFTNVDNRKVNRPKPKQTKLFT